MLDYTHLNVGFALLCPERNIAGLRMTTRRIGYYADGPQVCITENKAKALEMKEMKECCPSYKGNSTITSLMNVGLQKLKTDWVMFLMAGCIPSSQFLYKITNFITSDKDILFPIVEQKFHFYNCSLNGLLMHRKVLKDIGKFDEDESLELCRIVWALDAMDAGYQFKAINGATIF